MAGPSCHEHMAQWNPGMSPAVLTDSVMALDDKLFDTFKDDSNVSYVRLSILKEAAGHKTDSLPRAWAAMTNRSNVYLTNKSMMATMQLSIALAWETKRLSITEPSTAGEAKPIGGSCSASPISNGYKSTIGKQTKKVPKGAKKKQTLKK